MNYQVVLTRGKNKETLYITECSCAGEAERKALQQKPGFSIYDISRCGENPEKSDFGKKSEDD